MNQGILYCATGIKYYNQAKTSARSALRYSGSLEFAICTSISETDDFNWTKVIPMAKSTEEYDQYMIDKIRSLLLSPFDLTLYLDSDTYILDEITELFTILNKFDIALCHGHNRLERYNIQHGLIPHRNIKRKAVPDTIPYAFAPLQGGLILFKRNEKINIFLNDLLDLYRKKQFYDDQAIIRELIWKSELKFYILPPEYNFNSLKDYKYWKINNYIARPKIFHYTKHKGKNIERLLQKADRKVKLGSLLKSFHSGR